MTKSEIMEIVHERTGFSKKRSAEVVSLVLDIVAEAVENGEKVKISGFGNFEVRRKKERSGRNPKTGEEVVIPERHVLAFKPSPLLKEQLNRA